MPKVALGLMPKVALGVLVVKPYASSRQVKLHPRTGSTLGVAEVNIKAYKSYSMLARAATIIGRQGWATPVIGVVHAALR